ncbi:hypothetical protein BUALT_Bualt12G0056600 [Buddleja alternifolia]|uniref:RING-type E3 ubiquitin transferase n=1 Tax=Buddleja alternifolia TaxID=168488 RepID=A0AAV6WXF3_9LAMI|nr:hypothetical protein BUALT_Bualt12G0056600 [Buddleja alternifolia]
MGNNVHSESPSSQHRDVDGRGECCGVQDLSLERRDIRIFVAYLVLTWALTIELLHGATSRHRRATTTSAAFCGGGIYNNTSLNHPPSRINSGINRKVIESLPLFRFSSLRGQKDGLECAVCLNKFEPEEILRLLPKCKHAFHVECVDTWLDGHSTCPLCRYRVDPEDVLLVDSKSLYNQSHQNTPRNSDQENCRFSGNARISGRHSYAGERGSSLEIIVENPGNDLRGRVSLDSWNSRRKPGNCEQQRSKASRKDGQLPVQGDKHRLEHRIIISGGEAADEEEAQRRWSDVQAVELLYLKTEMILGGGQEEGGSGRGVINERSVSEITGMSRFPIYGVDGCESRMLMSVWIFCCKMVFYAFAK